MVTINPRFSKDKDICLKERLDCSRKGSIDEPIVDIINLINILPNYFTTSSCSGRLCLISKSKLTQKEGTKFILTSHEEINQVDQLINLLEINYGPEAKQSTDDVTFKLESAIIHVSCDGLESAKKLHGIAVNCGYKNSGITLGKNGRVVTAIRGTIGLEVPLCKEGQLLVGHDYIKFVLEVANEKMRLNHERINRLRIGLKQSFLKSACDATIAQE